MPTLSNEQAARAMIANGAWADRLGWRPYATAIATAIGAPSAALDTADFAQAAAVWQSEHSLSVDGIVGPNTWGALKSALSPLGSITGFRPAGAPAVPNGIDAVIALYGDPRGYFAADGTIPQGSSAAEADWERKTLARGTFPWGLTTDGGVATSFTAHRLLVSTFEAVFQEIDRLGLRDSIKTYDGIYNWRAIRGTTKSISLHLFGAAIDINASTNQRGTKGDMDPRIVDVFEHFGFFWGGRFAGLVDPMHFQYATGC